MSTTSNLDAPTRTRAVLVAMAVVLCGLLASASPAQAHTAFVGSDPADGSIVTEAVDEIVIEFTGVSTPAGEGFVALDADGRMRTPTTVTTDDDKVFRLAFDPPLAGGIVGVRWSVRAGDAHPIKGSFSFTVDAVVGPLDDAGDADIDELTAAAPDDGAASNLGRVRHTTRPRR